MQNLQNDGKPQNISRKKQIPSALLEILQTILMAAALYFVVDVVIDRVEVFNVSMEPTVVQSEVIFVNKLAYRLGEVDRGDIVTFHYPNDPRVDYIKRAIGLPGDEVKILDESVFINGIKIDEPYLNNSTIDEGTWFVPEGMYFVMGDNRQDSLDSRTWGFVPEKNLIGKALAVYWPITHIRILTHVDIYP
ncbi:MAG: signal peptidase I [Anaerolineaceae bacterium]